MAIVCPESHVNSKHWHKEKMSGSGWKKQAINGADLPHHDKENSLVGRHFKITELIWTYVIVNLKREQFYVLLRNQIQCLPGTPKHILLKNSGLLKVYNIYCYVAVAKTPKPSSSFSC